jgi:uncharacterized membrane protein YraQ (UPF0718 family)
MDIASFLLKLLQGGLSNLAAYLAAHVLLCLVPAFFIAGAMTALIPKESVTRFLGRNAPKYISYPAAALGAGLSFHPHCAFALRHAENRLPDQGLRADYPAGSRPRTFSRVLVSDYPLHS